MKGRISYLLLTVVSAATAFSPASQQTKYPTQLSSGISPPGNSDVSYGLNRRDVLVSASLAIAGGAVWQSEQRQISKLPSAFVTTGVQKDNRQIVGSVEDAIALIDAQCDRRFLHALVATDYDSLLYRRVVDDAKDARTANMIRIQNPSQDPPTGSNFREALGLPETSVVEEFAGDSPFHLTTNSPGAVRSSSVSVWPLGSNVHFAWPEKDQDKLWSTNGESLLTPSKSLIVDGVDCGVMSLEDALERPKGQQVMVHSYSLLLVPVAMEKELIAGLKQSFII